MNPAVVIDVHDSIGVLDYSLKAVFGGHHRDAEIVDEPRQRGEYIVGRRRIERGRWLVEHQDSRAGGEHRTDRNSLLLPG